MQNLELDIEVQGHPAGYVGVNIKRIKDGSIKLSQRALIDTIIEDADLNNSKTTPPDIMYATHQLAKYSSNPREPHREAALYLVRYLKKSRDIGICVRPDPEKGFECYCDAYFSGAWNKQFA